MVFCDTCANTQRVALMLRNLGFTAIPLHGQMSQVPVLAGFLKCHAMELYGSVISSCQVFMYSYDMMQIVQHMIYVFRFKAYQLLKLLSVCSLTKDNL